MDRGQVWLANPDRSHGTEPGKTRPVLVVQAQALLDAAHPSALIIPLTTSLVENAAPLRVRVPRSGGLRQNSDLLIDQLRAIDTRRLVRGPLASLSASLMLTVDDALREVLDLVDA